MFSNVKSILSLALVLVLVGLSLPAISSATVTATAVISGPNYKSWTITCADADTSGTISHGFKGIPPGASPSTDVAPDMVVVVPLNATIAAAGLVGITTSSTTITLTKATTSGSCGASPGTSIAYKVFALRPSSLTK